jgi:hypothetical protein
MSIQLHPLLKQKQVLTDEAFLEHYHKGLNDSQIAKVYNITKQSVWIRRQRLMLPAHFDERNSYRVQKTPEQMKETVLKSSSRISNNARRNGYLHYKKNKADYANYTIKWYKTHPEKWAEYQRKSHAKFKQKILEYARNYYVMKTTMPKPKYIRYCVVCNEIITIFTLNLSHSTRIVSNEGIYFHYKPDTSSIGGGAWFCNSCWADIIKPIGSVHSISEMSYES